MSNNKATEHESATAALANSAEPSEADAAARLAPNSQANEVWCSWCLSLVAAPGRGAQPCPNCANKTRTCMAPGCQNLACWGQLSIAEHTVRHRHLYCAEHRGAIADFSTVNASLAAPDEFRRIYQHSKRNYAHWTRLGLWTVGGIAVAGPVAALARSALGAVGATAVAKAGTMLLGPGFGIAGGSAVMTMAGSAVGGALGAYIGNAYFSDIQGFNIHRIRAGRQPAIITVNGFMQQSKASLDDWAGVLNELYPGHAWYHVDWEAKNLAKLGRYAAGNMGMAAARTAITSAANRLRGAVVKQAKIKTASVPGLNMAALATNPWHVALVKAEKTGVLLADILRRCQLAETELAVPTKSAQTKQQSFVLMGHSLGARVVYNCLRTLATTDAEPCVERAWLLAAAVDAEPSYWAEACAASRAGVVNAWSSNDSILKYMYSAGTFFRSKPAGRYPIEGIEAVQNCDLSAAVSGHMQFKQQAVGKALAAYI